MPVYLYGEAAVNPTRKALPNIRSGEYEGLIDKLMQPEWAPDYGPADFVPSWGATAAGARKFLLAYNVNLLATKEQAHRIALNIREKGDTNYRFMEFCELLPPFRLLSSLPLSLL